MTTAFAASPRNDAARLDRKAVSVPAVEIVSDLREVATAWRALEAEAVMTPYGRYDWVAAYQDNHVGAQTRVAILRGADQEIDLLLPLQIERRGPLKVATAIGGKHANYNLPLLRQSFAARLTGERAAAILKEVGRALGVDMISVPNVPVTWNGWSDPFAVGGQASASDAWALRLEPDGDAALARSMSNEARKKARNKLRSLAKIAPVTLLRAANPAEVERILDTYGHQKAQRFAELGIADPFADPALRMFFREASIAGLTDGNPAIEFYALLAGDDILAVIGGASDGHRFSGMVVSFQAGPLDKFSPGELLVMEVVRDLGARGFKVFDLGVGDARYKRSICEEIEPLVDVLIPLTGLGRLAVLLDQYMIDVKRRLKANPRAVALLTGLRRLKARSTS